jgi:hypothetical protein
MSTRYSQLASFNTGTQNDMKNLEPATNLSLDALGVDLSAWCENLENRSTLVASERNIKLPCIILVNLPEKVTARQARTLVRDLRHQLNVDQPCVVLDLSDVKEMDTAGLDLLRE